MPDKCQSHDHCFERVSNQIADMRDDLHSGLIEIKDMLHAGAVLHTEFRLRLESHEQAIASLQKEIALIRAVPEKRWGHVEQMALRLAERGILVVLGAALWALCNGYVVK